jgi:hypothetical protein
MKNKSYPVLLIIITLTLLINNCGKLPVSPSHTDWDAVKEIISENPVIFDMSNYDTGPDTLFYREVNESSPDIQEGKLSKADSTHWVDQITLEWTDIIKGKFHYYSNGEWREKPFSTYTSTDAYFERWGEIYDLHRGWILEEFSQILTFGYGPSFQSVHITSEGVDTTIPQYVLSERRLIGRNSTLVFGLGKQVTFTLSVNPAESTDFSLLFVQEGPSYKKIPFTYQDGNLSASWVTTSDPSATTGYHKAIVDRVWRESITSDTTECKFSANGIIYRLK